jgi:hypothetical protein
VSFDPSGPLEIRCSAAKARVGNGVYFCSNMVGTTTFTPAWSDSGTGTVKVQVSFQSTSCGGALGYPAPHPTPSGVTLSGSFTLPNGNGNCSAGLTAAPAQLTLIYVPNVKPSGWKTGNVGLVAGTRSTMQAPIGKPATVTGSYPSAHPFMNAKGAATGDCSAGITKMTFSNADLLA